MRKGKPKKRYIAPDSRFEDPLVTRFVNNLMWKGKKALAFSIFYKSIDLVEKKLSTDSEKVNGIDIWRQAMENSTPSVEVRSRRVGGATFQVPTEIRPQRKQILAIKWLIKYARARNEKTMIEKLAGEIIAASKKEGTTVKRKEDVHKMAESNRAFSHFRF